MTELGEVGELGITDRYRVDRARRTRYRALLVGECEVQLTGGGIYLNLVTVPSHSQTVQGLVTDGPSKYHGNPMNDYHIDSNNHQIRVLSGYMYT